MTWEEVSRIDRKVVLVLRLAHKRARHVEVLAVSLYVAVNRHGEGRTALSVADWEVARRVLQTHQYSTGC